MGRSLLVPFNGDAAAGEALRAACALARPVSGSVVALYVVRVPRQLPLTTQLPGAAAEVRAVEAAAERIGQANGVSVWFEWVFARAVAPAVVDVAEELGVDEILLGLSRRQRLPIWLWPWSTAAQILANARRPVLVRVAEPVARPSRLPAPQATA